MVYVFKYSKNSLNLNNFLILNFTMAKYYVNIFKFKDNLVSFGKRFTLVTRSSMLFRIK